jgi:hypothetical protein
MIRSSAARSFRLIGDDSAHPSQLPRRRLVNQPLVTEAAFGPGGIRPAVHLPTLNAGRTIGDDRLVARAVRESDPRQGSHARTAVGRGAPLRPGPGAPHGGVAKCRKMSQ